MVSMDYTIMMFESWITSVNNSQVDVEMQWNGIPIGGVAGT